LWQKYSSKSSFTTEVNYSSLPNKDSSTGILSPGNTGLLNEAIAAALQISEGSGSGGVSAAETAAALQTMKAAGVSLAPITEVELSIATASETALANPEELSADALIRNVAIQSNLMKDAVIGPRDLVRLDGFGQPYKVGPSTLGVTPDSFDQHWLSIPPDVKAEWRSGAIPALPTDDPAYAEAANVINAMTKNYELYQGPLDRSVVGVVGAVPTDLPPVPEGVDPAAWRVMTDEQRALWQE
jgi:hypothetical protein